MGISKKSPKKKFFIRILDLIVIEDLKSIILFSDRLLIEPVKIRVENFYQIKKALAEFEIRNSVFEIKLKVMIKNFFSSNCKDDNVNECKPKEYVWLILQ